MCRISDGCWSFFSDGWHTARKPHRCDECSRKIEAGERYEWYAGCWDGDFQAGKTCRHCFAARRWLSAVCDGWNYSEVGEDLLEHVIGEEEYMRSRPLARLCRWMRDGWRTKEGDLRAVDDVAALTKTAIAAAAAMGGVA